MVNPKSITTIAAPQQIDKRKNAKYRAIDAAESCFIEMGVVKTSMEDVAKKAEMARSTLYRYFKDKDQLIMAVLEREAESIAHYVGERISRYSDIRAYFIEGILLAVNTIESNQLLIKLFLEDSNTSISRIILTSDRLQVIGIQTMREIIEPARSSGFLRDDISEEKIMDWLLRIVFSILTTPSEFTSSDEKKRELLNDMLLPVIIKN